VYNKDKSKKALNNCLSQMYNNRNNGKWVKERVKIYS
jgi:hypothetical protein